MIESFARRALRIGALAVLAGLGACTTVLLPPNITPVVAPSRSVDEARARLSRAATERAAAEAEFSASEQVCYSRFFVNSCLDDAKEKRRSALAMVRALEVEAEYYVRKAEVDQRDREVEQAVKAFEEDEARAAAAPAPEAAPVAEPKARAPRASLAERRASQEAKLARRAAEEQAAAPARAAKARAFEERRRKSEQRQREIDAKKAEKAAKAADPAR